MRASIIIPARNEEALLAEALRAVLDQDHPDFEVIIVDNGSTDRTAAVAGGFPVKIVREERRGTMWACERGRLEASGQIIVRMDADCLPDRSWLSRGLAHFSDPDVSGASGPYDYHDSHAAFRWFALVFQSSLYHRFNRLAQALGSGAVMIGGNSFMRASALAAEGGFDTALTFYGDDTDTAKRLARHGKVVFDSGLVMKTSARRFKKEGIIRLESRYILHFFKQIFMKRKPPQK
ncbi:MAG: glycosyltransferase family 2 protein [Minisyncoccia bacterium]|jgi:glycosyltransferase involved in cell wall biosynthesis